MNNFKKLIGALIWMRKIFKMMKINKNYFSNKIKMKTFLTGKSNAIKNTEVKIKDKSLWLVLTAVSVHRKVKKNHKLRVKFLLWRNKRSQRNNCGKEQNKNVKNAEMSWLWWLSIKIKKEKRALRLTCKMIDLGQCIKIHCFQSTLQTQNSTTKEQVTFSNKL